MSTEIILAIVVIAFAVGVILQQAWTKRGTPPSAGGQSGGGNPSPPPTNPASKKFWQTTWFQILFALIAVGILLWGYSILTTPDPDTKKAILELPQLPTPSELPAWKSYYGFMASVALLVIGLSIQKEPIEWLKPLLLTLAVIVFVITWAFSGFGQYLGKQIERAEVCISTGDCGRRTGDLDIIRGGTVVLKRNDVYNAIFVGKVTVIPPVGYCVRSLPDEDFEMTWSEGAQRIFLEAYSGEPTEITLRAIPRDECTSE